MRQRLTLITIAGAGLLAACAPMGVGGGQPGGRMARFSPVDRDPVGFLLLNRDSLALPDSTVQQLVQLNLRLFRRNTALQIQIDSLTRDVRFDERTQRTDSARIPQELRDKVAPLALQIRAQTAAVKDTAWAMLTVDQRVKADSIEARQAAMMRRGPGASTNSNGRIGN